MEEEEKLPPTQHRPFRSDDVLCKTKDPCSASSNRHYENRERHFEQEMVAVEQIYPSDIRDEVSNSHRPVSSQIENRELFTTNDIITAEHSYADYVERGTTAPCRPPSRSHCERREPYLSESAVARDQLSFSVVPEKTVDLDPTRMSIPCPDRGW